MLHHSRYTLRRLILAPFLPLLVLFSSALLPWRRRKHQVCPDDDFFAAPDQRAFVQWVWVASLEFSVREHEDITAARLHSADRFQLINIVRVGRQAPPRHTNSWVMPEKCCFATLEIVVQVEQYRVGTESKQLAGTQQLLLPLLHLPLLLQCKLIGL